MTIRELITYLTEKSDGDLDMEVQFKYWSNHMKGDDRDFNDARIWCLSQGFSKPIGEMKGTPHLVIDLE